MLHPERTGISCAAIGMIFALIALWRGKAAGRYAVMVVKFFSVAAVGFYVLREPPLDFVIGLVLTVVIVGILARSKSVKVFCQEPVEAASPAAPASAGPSQR
jgi:hypothetical protein